MSDNFNIEKSSIVNIDEMINLIKESYQLGNYHLCYVLSNKYCAYEKEFCLVYQILSLLRLKYYNLAFEMYKSEENRILNTISKGQIDFEHILDLLIMFEISYDCLNKELRDWLFGSKTKKVQLYKIIMDLKKVTIKEIVAKKLLEFLIPFQNDIMIISKIYLLLTKYYNKNYYNYLCKDYFDQNDLLQYDNNHHSGEHYLKIYKTMRQKVKYYNHQDEELSIYSYEDDNKRMVSLHVIKYKEYSLILDCGGIINRLNSESIDVKAFLNEHGIKDNSVKGVFISHAHFDHYGSINNLNFLDVPIYMTKHTYNLIKINNYNIDIKNPIIYVMPNEPVRCDEFLITPFSNGHILGSCGFEIRISNKRIVYTGDFSIKNQYTIDGFDLSNIEKKPDYLIIESTYGQKRRVLKYEDYEKCLVEIVKLYLHKKVKILFPAFSIGRAQELALILKKHINAKIVIDGLAEDITMYYQMYSKQKIIYDSNIYMGMGKIMQNIEDFDIIIASSGLLNDTISSKYYQSLLTQPFVLIKTGYAQEDNFVYSLSRFLDDINVIFYDIPLSAHAGYYDLVKTIVELNPKNIIFVHGKGVDVS